MPVGRRWNGETLAARVRLARLARRALGPVVERTSPLRGERFELWGVSHPYFVHRYNLTWRNERAVEIPLARAFLAADGVRGTTDGLEFGNVLSHYGLLPGGWDVVDRYEVGTGVRNVDVLDYRPARPLGAVVSVSTLEHVGWDEHPRRPDKVLAAFDHLCSLLGPGGRMLLTAPLGHNDVLDEAVLDGRWPVARQATLVRDGRAWRATDDLEWRPYDHGGRGGIGAGSVWVCEVGA